MASTKPKKSNNTAEDIENIEVIADDMVQKEEDSDCEVDLVEETTALNRPVISSTDDNRLVTLTGTIKRGRKSGATTEIKVSLTKDAYRRLESQVGQKSLPSKDHKLCSAYKGPHVFLWSLMCFPFVLIMSGGYSFYVGTLTWYNAITFYTEEKPMSTQIAIVPALVCIYPLYIICMTFGLGIYSAFDQVTYKWSKWTETVRDLEKGFYGWLCSQLSMDECSPYTEVVIVDQFKWGTQ